MFFPSLLVLPWVWFEKLMHKKSSRKTVSVLRKHFLYGLSNFYGISCNQEACTWIFLVFDLLILILIRNILIYVCLDACLSINYIWSLLVFFICSLINYIMPVLFCHQCSQNAVIFLYGNHVCLIIYLCMLSTFTICSMPSDSCWYSYW